MKTETSLLDAERIEQFSTLALVAGVLLVFQTWTQVLSWLGLLLLAIGVIGTLTAQTLNKNYVARIVERMIVIGMMIGILGMLQTWQIWMYQNGFYLLALSTLGFIIVSHIGSTDE